MCDVTLPLESAEKILTADTPVHELVLGQLALLEFPLGDASWCGAVTGHLIIDGKLAPLPFGSSIKDGTFRWQPGVGYLGAYDFVFTSDCGTVRLRAVLKP